LFGNVYGQKITAYRIMSDADGLQESVLIFRFPTPVLSGSGFGGIISGVFTTPNGIYLSEITLFNGHKSSYFFENIPLGLSI
jgi:hypothetical protein